MNKKNILFIICLVFSFFSFISNAQDKHSFAFGSKVVIGSIDEFGGDILVANISYLYNATGRLSVGAGAGIGTADALRSWSVTNVLEEDKKRDSQLLYSIFARGKFKFTTKPTSLYLLLDVGYNSSSFESWSGESYNPLGFFATPALGLNIGLPNNNIIALSVGIQGQNTQYNEIKYKYSDVLKKMVYDSFSLKSGGFTGLIFSAEYIF
jgi:hypothetical protein